MKYGAAPPEDYDLVEQYTRECRPGMTEDEWWTLGSRMHIVSDDFKILYPEEYLQRAKPLVDSMWEAWSKSDPRGARHDPSC